MSDTKTLLRAANSVVNRRVRYAGTNGNEYDRANYGKTVNGSGLLKEVHQVGQKIVLVIEKDDIARTLLCVDATSVKAA